MKLLRIENIEKQDQYDIEVADTHCFFANGVLVHNSNYSCMRPVTGHSDDIWFQSRERIITPLSDNAGSASWGHVNREGLNKIFDRIALEHSDKTDQHIQIYGEWAGQGIQKNVAIATLPKAFYIFAARKIDSWCTQYCLEVYCTVLHSVGIYRIRFLIFFFLVFYLGNGNCASVIRVFRYAIRFRRESV